MAIVRSHCSNMLLGVLVALLASQTKAINTDPAYANDYRTTAADCHNSSSLAICEAKENCTWCKSTLVPSGCYHESEAKFLPGVAFKCDLAPTLETPSAGCLMKTNEEECSDNEQCVWCSSLFGNTCFSQDQAKILPAGFYQCKETQDSATSSTANAEEYLASGYGPGGGDPAPGPGGSCSGATEEKPCKKQLGCVWCSGSFGPGSCYSEDQAKYLPAQFFKCSKPKKPSDSDNDDNTAAASTTSAAAASSASAVDIDEAIAAADAPAPGPEPDCSSAKEKKLCKKEPGCVWCDLKFGSGSCYSEDQAKWLPAQFFKCSKPSAENELQAEQGDVSENDIDGIAAA